MAGISGYPLCHQTKSIKTLKETHSTYPQQKAWPRAFLIYHRTSERKALLPLCWD